MYEHATEERVTHLDCKENNKGASWGFSIQ